VPFVKFNSFGNDMFIMSSVAMGVSDCCMSLYCNEKVVSEFYTQIFYPALSALCLLW